MIYANKDYQEPFPALNWKNNPQINFCNSIIEDLTEKEQKFLHYYYWLGYTEKKIAGKLDYQSQQAISVFRDRVFAKMRMLADLKQIYIPKCFSITLKNQYPGFYKSFLQLLNPKYINKITEDGSVKLMMETVINFLLNYLDSLECVNNCIYRFDCSRVRSRNKSLMKTINPKFIQEMNTSSITCGLHEFNLQLIKKILTFLLNWRVYHEKH
jgi:hypothetical protein